MHRLSNPQHKPPKNPTVTHKLRLIGAVAHLELSELFEEGVGLTENLIEIGVQFVG